LGNFEKISRIKEPFGKINPSVVAKPQALLIVLIILSLAKL
jgi:hypothetical protein